jgi:hypothetical protein
MGGAFMPPLPRQVHPVAEGFAPRDLAHPVQPAGIKPRD